MKVRMSNELSEDNNFNESLELKTEKTEIILSDSVEHVYKNTNRNIIIISDDKLELNAMKFKNCIESRAGLLGWGGMLVSVILTLVTADFHDLLGVSNSVIHAFFYLVALTIGIVMIVNIGKLIYGYYRKRNVLSVEDFITMCRNSKI